MLVWPDDYAELHSTDHEIADMVTENLANAFMDEPYVLEVPGGIRGGRTERRQMVSHILETIIRNRRKVEDGWTIGDDEPLLWRFRRQEPQDRDPAEPMSGVEVRFNDGNPFEAYAALDPNWRTDVAARVNDLVRQAEAKFRAYRDDDRLLLMECYTGVTLDWIELREMVMRCKLAPDMVQIWLSLPPDAELELEASYTSLLDASMAVQPAS